jgi:hypothetical protein
VHARVVLEHLLARIDEVLSDEDEAKKAMKAVLAK